jgi:hypothetical protein
MVLVSSPESTREGTNVGLARGDLPEGNKKGRAAMGEPAEFGCLCGARSGGGQETQSSRPGNRLRPAVDAEACGQTLTQPRGKSPSARARATA